MKKQVKYGMLSLILILTGWIAATAQVNEWEVPGDNFSLEGALELFKKSSSPEEFEQLLNSADSKVNNLDLNEDGRVDYIKVIDRNEGNIHAFILQAIVSDREYQDVAVIELEKLANGKAVLQITGDEDIYGIETIIEPTEEVRLNAGTTVQRRVVNVWAWPSVRYVYSPYYSVWVSPWQYSLRPVWWSAWGPVAYYDYYPYWNPYRSNYAVCYTHRVSYARNLYLPYRTTSVVVYKRHNDRVAQYRSRYSREEHYNRGRQDYGRSNDRRDDVANGRDARNDNRTNRGDSYTRNNADRDNTSRTVSKPDFNTQRSQSQRPVELRPINEPVRRSATTKSYSDAKPQGMQRDMNRGTKSSGNSSFSKPTTQSKPTTIQRSAPREIQRSVVGKSRSTPVQRQSTPREVRKPMDRPAAPVIRSSPSRNSTPSGVKKSGEIKKRGN